MFKILLLDSEKKELEKLQLLLEDEDYEVFTATDSKEAIELAKTNVPHLILLDIFLPGTDGIETCLELKRIKEIQQTLIVFYTQREEEYSQISAFNAGADDYLFKSIKPKPLISRIRAILKRHQINYSITDELDEIRIPVLKIDREKYLVLVDDKELMMPKKEFELLALLYSSPRKVFSRQELSDKIWGYDVYDKNRTIDVHIGKLRGKIGDRFIRTVKGKGYSLEL